MKSLRIKAASKIAGTHLVISILVAFLAAALVFGLWFPSAYRHMTGGTTLFGLIVIVDVICGPLLTLVLFNPLKSKLALRLDLTLVGLVQLAALLYGLWTLLAIRPLYVPLEINRFKVVTQHDLSGANTDILPEDLRPGLLKGPVVIGIRSPKDAKEQNDVVMESSAGGADFGERPNFYIAYDDKVAARALSVGRDTRPFLQKYPGRGAEVQAIAAKTNQSVDQLKYIPIIARHDWIAILDSKGYIAGYVEGDGF